MIVCVNVRGGHSVTFSATADSHNKDLFSFVCFNKEDSNQKTDHYGLLPPSQPEINDKDKHAHTHTHAHAHTHSSSIVSVSTQPRRSCCFMTHFASTHTSLLYMRRLVKQACVLPAATSRLIFIFRAFCL